MIKFIIPLLLCHQLSAADQLATNVINQLNQMQSQLQNAGTIASRPADCSTCAKPNPLDSLSYTPCAEGKNTYLNQKLQTPYKQALELIGDDLHSPQFEAVARCINAGLNFDAVGSTYNCTNAKTVAKTLKKSPSPCASKELIGTLSAEILRASECLGRDYKKVLPIFMHESRFRPNVSSPSGAGGVGQLTGIAIKEVNRFIDDIKELSSKPGCQYLNDIQEMDSKYSCARLIMPPNPRLNIIYGIYYQAYIEDADPRYSPKSVVSEWQAKRTKKLTQAEVDHITEVLLHVSYNGGKGAALPAFQTVIKDPKVRNLSLKDFLPKYFAKVKAKAGAEPAKYHNSIVKDSELLEANAGADCTIY